MTSARPTLQDIEQARQRITPFINHTPAVRSEPLSAATGAEVYLKLESEQPTGSFKVRGAANTLLSLTEAERCRGVVAVSTGNHGRAVAQVARELGVRAVICLSRLVPANKVEAIRELGAELHIHGDGQDQAFERAQELIEADGLTLVPPFDAPPVVCGQATIGLELLDDLPALDRVLVPLSGGGLVGGVALAVTSRRSEVAVTAVSAERVSVMLQSVRAGRPLEVEEQPSLADSLGGGIGLNNQLTFALVRDLVDDHVVVDEEDIARAMAFAHQAHGLRLEGAAVVGVAALLRDEPPVAGETVAVVVSGRNVAPEAFAEAIDGR